MTNDGMTNARQSTDWLGANRLVLRHSCFVILSSFVIRHSSFPTPVKPTD
ncbi:MAG TPA: hypothetical protein VFI31_13965 [Pirellulales bacterium]|nr:hypothetical protein [Pirellulales bacterium]